MVIEESDGEFMEESETYHKITQESEDVYSTDYGWGLYKDDDNSSAKSSKYRRTYTGNERNQLISSVDSSYSTAYVYGQDGQRSYYGARYLDPKYSMWISTDPALGEYIPIAPTNDEAKRHNSNLPGMGGVFNHINFNLYHYAGNSPVRYTDPDGRLMRDAEGNLVFDPDKDKNGNAVIEKNGGGTVKQDGGKTIRFDRIPGYLYTDRGSKVRAYKNLTDDKDLQTNCIGTTFADGEYWIEPDSASWSFFRK